jgi:hypothetical protein
MDEIKSAADIAREKVEKLGAITEEERLKWKYVPEGEKLAAKYLKEKCNLVAELNKYPETTRKYVIDGASDILVRNITLPGDSSAEKTNRRVMDGLKTLKSDKVSVENVFSKMRRIFNHYQEQGEQQKRQAYASLKAEFQTKLQQAIQQQMGPVPGINIDVEREPQFQEEWRKVLAQLDSQYLTFLNEYKQELLAIP